MPRSRSDLPSIRSNLREICVPRDLLRCYSLDSLFGASSQPSQSPRLLSLTLVLLSQERFSQHLRTKACLKSFPFNQTLQTNVMATVSRVFDFYTFEDYYPSSAPFPNTIDIRAELARINSTVYPVRQYISVHPIQLMCAQTDYDFNLDLYNFINQLNDGHTGE
jgi:hypothetical protein